MQLSVKPIKRSRTFVKWILLFLIQATLVLVCLEVLARIFDPLGISYFPETARYLDTLIREEPIGYRNRANLQGRYFGVDLHINQHGMRDREVPEEKQAGEYRIMVLGDSIPFGMGVAYEGSIPYQLEQIANQTAPPSRHYRTLNMGVPSYNTEQEYYQLKSLGLSLKPDLVLLMYVGNDVQPKMWVFEKRSKWWKELGQRSYAISLFYMVTRAFNPNLFGRRGMMVANRAAAPTSPGWQRVDTYLTKINRLCRERGLPFVLLGPGTEQSPLIKQLKAVGSREGFAVIPWIIDRKGRFRNSFSDGHPNAAGGRVIAEILHQKLRQFGFLP